MSILKATSSCVDSLSFRIYTDEDIKRLSVLQIANPVTFDPLGHATIGGLCDSRLGIFSTFNSCAYFLVFQGPIKRYELCQTCNLTDLECPGHFGHIVLPLPIFNPFFLRYLFSVWILLTNFAFF